MFPKMTRGSRSAECQRRYPYRIFWILFGGLNLPPLMNTLPLPKNTPGRPLLAAASQYKTSQAKKNSNFFKLIIMTKVLGRHQLFAQMQNESVRERRWRGNDGGRRPARQTRVATQVHIQSALSPETPLHTFLCKELGAEAFTMFSSRTLRNGQR
jgi:hypothetical protein